MLKSVFTPDLLRKKCKITNKLVRNCLAELFGTFLLLFIGECIIAQFILTHEKLNTWIQINIGWGFAISFSVYTVYNLSGGHLNPAVSLVFYSFGEIDAITFGLYCISQTIGAFLGGAATYGLYFDAINEFEGGSLNRTVYGPNATAGIFATYPAKHVSMIGAYFDQICGTAILCLFVVAIIDRRNEIPRIIRPILFGFVVMLIGTGYGMNVGYPINPARDFGPRIFSFLIYGTDVFTYPYASWFLVPIFGPLIGGLLGAWLYYIFAGIHIPDKTVYESCDDEKSNVEKALV